MGTFTYDASLRVDFDDRVLFHLQLVFAAKLRRGESFMFTWTKPANGGGGRTTVWVDRQIPVSFDYQSSTMPTVSRPWVDELMATTFTALGLQIVPDPGESDSESESVPRAVEKDRDASR